MKRRLAAILATDIIGSTRLMGVDEEGALERIRSLQDEVIDPLITAQDGRVVKYLGDGALAEFPSVVNAVQAATEILSANKDREASQSDDRRIRLRIGVNLGDIIAEDDDIYGDGVNIAARLEALADPDGLCISGIAFQGLGASRAGEFSDSGAYHVKNVEKPVRVYRWRAQGGAEGERVLEVKSTIAISPFAHSSPDFTDLAEGLTEDIAVAIGSVGQLIVIEEDKAMEPPRYRLSGGVRGSGGRLRVQARLVDQFTGVQVWAERFDRVSEDHFEIQDDLAQTIVIDVHTTLGAGAYTNRWNQGTHNFSAWRISAMAFHEFQKYSPDAMEACVRLWSKAQALDPDFPTPRIAGSYCRARIALWSPERKEELLAIAQADYEFAMQITDQDDSRPQSLLRAICIARGDFDGAVEAAEVGLAREPGPGNGTLSYALMMADRNEEALVTMRKAIEAIPNYPGWYSTIKILACYFTGQLEEAREEAEKMSRLQPDFYTAPPLLAALNVELGADQAAREAAKLVKARDARFNSDQLVASFGLKNRKNAARVATALRKAGL